MKPQMVISGIGEDLAQFELTIGSGIALFLVAEMFL